MEGINLVQTSTNPMNNPEISYVQQDFVLNALNEEHSQKPE